jgi:hypothetical protein
MKNRCDNKNNVNYKYYGAKGISYIEEWYDYDNFHSDMYVLYKEHCSKFGEHNTTLDRIDTTKDYSKDNCRWATYEVQGNNKSNNILLSYNGKTLTIAQWAKELNIRTYVLRNRYKQGWSTDRILSSKVRDTEINMTGQRINRLLVIEKDLSRLGAYWICTCDCGKTKSIKGKYLRNGDAKSCGCMRSENLVHRGGN